MMASGELGLRGAEEMPALFDMHCHLGFASNFEELARAVNRSGAGVLCATVQPHEYLGLASLLNGSLAGNGGIVDALGNSVRLGVGLHPWWVADGICGEEDVALCERLAVEAPFIAEIGLDFGRRHGALREGQIDAFRRICAVAGRTGGKVLSIHAVNAAVQVLDILEETGCAVLDTGCGGEGGCICILHWYSGPSDQLQRAIKLGCFFSVGERMLATRRGREYVRAIPESRLLLETDLPDSECGAFDRASISQSLERALSMLEEARGAWLGERIARTSRAILRLDCDAGAACPLSR